MANEISIQAALSCTKDGASVSASASKGIDMAGTEKISLIQTIPSTSENLSLTDIGTPGYVYLKNLSSTYTVSIHLTPAVVDASMITLLPGEFAVFPTRKGASGSELAAICHTGGQTVALQIICVEL